MGKSVLFLELTFLNEEFAEQNFDIDLSEVIQFNLHLVLK